MLTESDSCKPSLTYREPIQEATLAFKRGAPQYHTVCIQVGGRAFPALVTIIAKGISADSF